MSPAGAAPPRTGGRTQQGSQARPRTGGRTQQGTGGGRQVKPVPASQRPAPPAPPSSPGRAAGQGGRGRVAGAVVALFLYPMGLALIEGGPARLKQWIAAKFWNGTTPPPGKAGQAGRRPRRHVRMRGPL